MMNKEYDDEDENIDDDAWSKNSFKIWQLLEIMVTLIRIDDELIG